MNILENIYEENLKVFSLANSSKKEDIRIQKDNIALKIVALLPFIACCDNPTANSLLNINTFFFVSDSKLKHYFFHNVSNNRNLFSRLSAFFSFWGGNKKTIQQGMLLLSLIMIQDYYYDKQIDIATNKYNPFNTKCWNFHKIKNYILSNIVETSIVFKYFKLQEVLAQKYWWKEI